MVRAVHSDGGERTEDGSRSLPRGRFQEHQKPRLRLVGAEPTVGSPSRKAGKPVTRRETTVTAAVKQKRAASPATQRKLGSIGKPITGPSDPRWVLAVRTAEDMEGSVLSPERRDRLVRIGRMMGLTAFDANIIIAIVQDQARRGFEPAYCPIAGEQQIEMVPLPRRHQIKSMLPAHNAMKIAAVLGALIATEIVILNIFF